MSNNKVNKNPSPKNLPLADFKNYAKEDFFEPPVHRIEFVITGKSLEDIFTHGNGSIQSLSIKEKKK